MQQSVLVDPNSSSVQRGGDSSGLTGVVGEDSSSEAVSSVVRQFKDFFLGLERSSDDHRAEDLR